MYAGRIVEHGPVDAVLDTPLHPYTQGLIDSLPSENRRGRRLRADSGMTPSLLALQPGLALSWKPLDPKTWEFKLRPGVKWA